jgi:hypothetical protein
MTRKRFLLVAPLVAVVGIAAAFLSLQTVLRTEATVGAGTMQLTATGSGVSCNGDNTKCTVPTSGAFSLNVAVADFPDGGYSAIAFDLDWSGTGLTKTPGDCSAAATEIVWPDKQGLNSCAPLAGEETTHFQGGDLSTAFGATPSTFKGNVVVYAMTCTSGNTTNVIDLVVWDPDNNPLGTALADASAALIPTSDSITINCGTGGGAEATPTPTTGEAATNTPESGATNTPAGPTATTEPGGPTNTPPAPTNTPPVQATNTPIVTQPTPTPIPSLGDVNGDGVVDSGDAQLVLQYEAGLADSGDLDLNAADVNRDGEVNSIDALFILWADAGMVIL